MLYLHGMGHFFPENEISNRFISELDIGSDEAWIMDRVGIVSRRTTLPLDYIRSTHNKDPREAASVSLYTHGRMGELAARMALARAGLQVGDIGMVICGTSSPPQTIPALAGNVAAQLNLEVPCLDINTACSTFVVQLAMVANMLPQSLPRFILIVNPECCTHVVNYSDRRVAPLFGDGCSAAVVSLIEKSEKQFVFTAFFSDPLKWDKIRIPSGAHFEQDGRAVQKFAIRKTQEMLQSMMVSTSESKKNFYFIGHQANLGVLRHAAESCGIAEEKHWYNVVEYGNTGCSGAPSVLSQHWQDLARGDQVGMAVVGAGLTWARAILKIAA